MNALRRGLVVSCGCFRREFSKEKATTHGESVKGATTEYRIWAAMKRRCNNPNRPEWKDYGGRGITYCDRWEKFENFLDDMGRRPANHSLDRINNELGYSKENCRWATFKTQNNNKRSNRRIMFCGEQMLLSDACKLAGINLSTAYRRIARGVQDCDLFKSSRQLKKQPTEI